MFCDRLVGQWNIDNLLTSQNVFLDKYEFLQKNCCDPFFVHIKSAKSSLSTLDIAKAERINSLTTGTNVKNKFRKFALNVWPGCH